MPKRQNVKISEDVWKSIYEDHYRGMNGLQILKKYKSYHLKESTLYVRLRRLKDGKIEGSASKYTDPSYLAVGDTAIVTDGAVAKDNGKIITVTRVGPTFVEGKDDKGNNVAAYKVKKTVQELQKTEEVSPPMQPEPSPVTTTQQTSTDEIIWERKLIYDIQTQNHLYRVRVEADSIEIIDGDDHTLVITKDRIGDIQLILKNLPNLLEGK